MRSYLSLICLIGLAICLVSHSPVQGFSASLFNIGNMHYLAKYLTDRVKAAESRGCVSGIVDKSICDPFAPAGDGCIFAVLLTGQLTIANVNVTFDIPFEERPEIITAISGVFYSTDKNCTVEPTDITPEGFTVKATLGGVLPFSLRASWMACDAPYSGKNSDPYY